MCGILRHPQPATVTSISGTLRMESSIWGCPRPLPSFALEASWQKGLEVKGGLQALQFNWGASENRGKAGVLS